MHALRQLLHLKTRQHKAIAAGTLCVVVVAVGLVYTEKPAEHPIEAKKDVVVTQSTDQPDEKKPSNEYQWQGAANEPKYITLSSIKNGGYIQKVGVDQHKQIAVPNNVHMAGWFIDTVRPGEKGLSIIDGHVDGRQADGIFKNLGKLKKDDTFDIQLGNGETRRFSVLAVTTVDTKDAAGILFSQDPTVESQLNLITCGGTFNTATKSYDKRVIVSAKHIAQ